MEINYVCLSMLVPPTAPKSKVCQLLQDQFVGEES